MSLVSSSCSDLNGTKACLDFFFGHFVVVCLLSLFVHVVSPHPHPLTPSFTCPQPIHPSRGSIKLIFGSLWTELTALLAFALYMAGMGIYFFKLQRSAALQFLKFERCALQCCGHLSAAALRRCSARNPKRCSAKCSTAAVQCGTTDMKEKAV